MWIYGNRRSNWGALLLVAVILLGVSQGLEGVRGTMSASVRLVSVGLAAACGLVGLWVRFAKRG